MKEVVRLEKLKLEIKYLKEDEIQEYKNNTRVHSKEQIRQIKNSIKEFGMCTPIGIHNGTIIYGHARFEALKQLKDFNENEKVVLLSADIQKQAMDKVRELGALNFVKKPIDLKKMEQILNSIIS